MKLYLVLKSERDQYGKPVYEVGTTKQYNAEERRNNSGKIVRSAWAADYGPQKNGAFNEYRQIVRRYGKTFGWREAQEVANWIGNMKDRWYNERVDYKARMTS